MTIVPWFCPIFASLAAIGIMSTSPLAGQNWPKPLADNPVHADLPLFTEAYEHIWPRHFDGPDVLTGCESRVAFGDWRYRQFDAPGETGWYRFSNYGVFHCAALIALAGTQEQLQYGRALPSFFIFLGNGRGRSGPVELWAIQMGGRPGSDYLLLSRPARAGLITSFSVLQRDCLPGTIRRSEANTMFRTRYCAISTQQALVGMARQMTQREPLGILQLISVKPEGDQ